MNRRKSPNAASAALLAPPSPSSLRNRRLSKMRVIFIASGLSVACFLALKASIGATAPPESHTVPVYFRALDSRTSSVVSDGMAETSYFAYDKESTIDTNKRQTLRKPRLSAKSSQPDNEAGQGDIPGSSEFSTLNDAPTVATNESVVPENKSEAWEKDNKVHAMDITPADSLVKEPAAIVDTTYSPDKHQSGSRKEPVVLSNKPAADAEVNISKYDPEIALVAVVSMQRSSSSTLTNTVLTNNETNPCVLSLNEIFVNSTVGSKDAWPVDGMDLNFPLFQIKPRVLRDFVLRVAKRRCINHLKQDDDNVCRNRCIVGFKEFNNQLSLEQHKWLWRNTPNLTIVVLERNVQDRWKSKWVAIQTGDWDTNGSLEHKNQIAAMDIPPIYVSETDEYCKSSKRIMNSACNFGQSHKEWYEFVRAKIHHKQRVEISFDAALLNGGSYARGLIAHALPFDFQDLLVPPAERIVDPELAFVAVVSMQRSCIHDTGKYDSVHQQDESMCDFAK